MINEKRLTDTFMDYVRIDSETGHEAAMARRLIDDLTAIGCRVCVDDSQDKTGCDTGSVIATLPGNAPGEPIAFFAHMDTVPPGKGIEPVIVDGVIRSAGETVLGADDKSGVAPIVEALRVMVEKDLPHPTVQAVFTVSEEVGLRGSRYLDYSKLVARRAVVFDTGLPGKIVVAAPGAYQLYVTVHGKKAHAGNVPEKGISAIQALADAIAHMKLLRVDEETTSNVGSFVSQFPNNVVPDLAKASFNLRSLSEEKLEAQADHMIGCVETACKKYGATFEFEKVRSYYAYRIPEDDALLQRIAQASRAVGLEPKPMPTGGGGDAHNINRHDMRGIVVGTGQTGAHTTDEHIAVSDLVRTARLVLELAKPE